MDKKTEIICMLVAKKEATAIYENCNYVLVSIS